MAAFERDEDGDRLTLHLMGAADRSCFCNLRVSDKGRLYFHRAEPVAADVDDVIHASHQPEISIRISSRAVDGEVAARNLAPVGLLVTGLISVDGACYRGPGLPDDQESALTIRDGLPFSCNHFRHNSKEGFRG